MMSAVSQRAHAPLDARVRALRSERLRVIDICGVDASLRTSDVFVSSALGSCIVLTLHDTITRVGGMLQCPLPSSDSDRRRAKRHPGMYVDTAVSHLLQRMEHLGAVRERLVARAAGAGSPPSERSVFRVGERNYAALRKALWRKDLVLSSALVGDRAPQTVFHFVDDGETLVVVDGEILSL